MRLEPATVRRALIATAVVEACTWLGLLAGMLVKYAGSGSETGVHVFGPLHGAAFLAYVAVVLLASRTFRWPVGVTLAGLASTVPPFTSLLFELWADRSGRLSRRDPVTA